jgi:glycosyltransferase 2 family protein
LDKQKIKIVIGILFSIAAIIIIVLLVDMREVWENLKKLSLPVVATVLSLYMINMLLRTLRWKLIIAQKTDIKFNLVFKALIYGYTLNQLLPLKMGEIGRAEYLTRQSGESRSFLLGTIVVERIMDMFIILMFFGFSVLFSETVLNNLTSNLFSVIFFIAAFLGGLFLFFNLGIVKKLTKRLPLKAEKFVDHVIDNLIQSVSLFSSYTKVIIILLLSLLVWGLTCFSFYLIIKDLNISVPFYAYFFIVSAGTMGMIIPATSANIGVYHAVAMGALMIFMVTKTQALAFAIIAHAFDFFPAVLLGTGLFIHGRFDSLKSFQNIEKTLSGNQETA